MDGYWIITSIIMNHYSHYEPLNLHRIVSSKQYQAMRHESILTASCVSIHRPCSKKIRAKGGFEVPKPCFHGGSLTHWQILTSHSETIQKPWDWMRLDVSTFSGSSAVFLIDDVSCKSGLAMLIMLASKMSKLSVTFGHSLSWSHDLLYVLYLCGWPQ